VFTARYELIAYIKQIVFSLEKVNTLIPILNPYVQRCLLTLLTGVLIFKRLTVRCLYKSFGVKVFILKTVSRCWLLNGAPYTTFVDCRLVSRIRGPTASMHLGCRQQAIMVPPLVSSVISRGAPRQATWESSISEKWNYGREMADQI
jgi:hypothetical protein